jgi:hypothetical protein
LKEVSQAERSFKARKKDLEDMVLHPLSRSEPVYEADKTTKKPKLDAINTRVAHSTKKRKRAEAIAANVIKERDQRAASLEGLERELLGVEKAKKKQDGLSLSFKRHMTVYVT